MTDGPDLASVQVRIRRILAAVREVEEWRQDYDPHTQEWYTLLALSDDVASLISDLPAEMLPPEEVRTPSPREYAFLDWLIALIDEVQQGK